MTEEMEILVRLGAGFAVMIVGLILALLLKGVDRKFAAWLQARIGPPLRQPFWDVAKLFQKDNIVPERAVPWAFNGAPLVAFIASLALLLFIPLGQISGIEADWLPVLGGYGDLILLIYLFAVPGLMMAIGGFASGSPLSTIGAQREMVMMMSYEFPLAIVVLTMAYRISHMDIAGGAFNLSTIVQNPIWSGDSVGVLGIVAMMLFTVVFFLIIPSELSKIPFDSPEAETEIGGGIIAEYSGTNLAMFYLSDAVKTVAFAALAIALFFPYNLSPAFDLAFLGGMENAGIVVVDVLFWVFKIELLYFLAVTVIRVGAARLKIDRLSWLYLVPLSGLALVGALLMYLDVIL